jgi:Protein of unknown function (DUF1236)
MKPIPLASGAAVALIMCGAIASAQMQQKGEEKTSPQAGSQKQQGAATKEPSDMQKGAKGAEPTQPKDQGKGTAQTQPKEPGTKGSAQTQPKEPGTKGSAQTQPKEPGTKGSAQTQPKEPGGKGSAQTQPQEQGQKGSAQPQSKEPSKESATKGAQKSQPSGTRMQLSEQQRTSVHQDIFKQSNVNRIERVNFSINVGTRVPRSVRLAALPASIISIVPQYRSYQYFVANDQICIVEPNSYEIVEVIAGPSQTARVEEQGGPSRLMLTEEEKAIILQNVQMDRASTLALGELTEGAPVPRDARLETFNETIVRQVPKVRNYKFFTAENRVAIVDPQASKIQVVIEGNR